MNAPGITTVSTYHLIILILLRGAPLYQSTWAPASHVAMADVTSSITTTTTTTAGPCCKLIPRQRRRRQRGRRRDEATTTRTVTTSIDYDAHDDVPGRAVWENGTWVSRGAAASTWAGGGQHSGSSRDWNRKQWKSHEWRDWKAEVPDDR